MFEVPWCQFPKQEGCLLWFVIQDQPTLLFVICDCSTSTQGKFVIGFLLFVIKELSSRKTRRIEESSIPFRSSWRSYQERNQWLQFRIISDSSIIQRKRRKVTVWYDEFRCTENLENKQDATYENKLFWEPIWNPSQFSSSCNSAYNRRCFQDPRREHSRSNYIYFTIICDIFNCIIISVEATY